MDGAAPRSGGPGREPGTGRALALAVLPAGAWANRRSISTRTAVSSSGPGTRRARGNARRRSARSRHAGSGCNHAPRPAVRARGSGTHAPSTTTTRTRSDRPPRARQPTQVRTGVLRSVLATSGTTGRPAIEESTAPPGPSVTVAAWPLERVTPVLTPIEHGATSRVTALGGGIGPDIDPPPGQPGGKSGVLPLTADGK